MKSIYILFCSLLSATVIFAQPANDLCNGATTVIPGGPCISGTTVGANDNWTGSVGCQGGGSHPDVWYSFVATGSQAQIVVTTSGPWTGNVELILVEGLCTTGFTLTGSQCSPSVLNATFNGLQIGVTYYFTISNVNNATPGPFQVCLTNSSPPTIAGQDCSSAAILCNANSFSQPTSNAGFGSQEVSPVNSCWIAGGERQSKWFKFTVGCTGTLEFNINPVNSNDDYDWAIWNISSDPAGCTTKGSAIACNWSGCRGATGLSSCANLNSEPGANNGGPGCSGNYAAWQNATNGNYNPITVTAGNTYALLVDNFSFSNSGFSLTFGGACGGGTAKIGPDAAFTYSVGACGTYNFTKTCQASNSTFLWQFGDGTTSTAQNPSHTYSIFGNFVITLQVTDALGCITVYSQPINIVATPLPTIVTPVVYCVGVIASPLTATGSNLLWYAVPTGGTGSSTAPTPSTTTPGTTSYYVSQTIGGCESPRVQIDVIVNTGPSVNVNSPAICAGQNATLIATPSTPGGTYSWSPGGFTTPSITVSPASTTTYTVTYSLSGCSNTGSGTVTVNAVPSVTVNSSAICAGQSATLTATPSTPGGTYSWSPGGATTQTITVSPGSTTIYTVTYSLSGCSNTGSGTVTVNATPSVSVNSSAICTGQNATLTATPSTPGGTYSWSPGGATTQSITVSPGSTTIYTVTYSLSGCSNIGSGTVTVNAVPSVTVNSSAICAGQSGTLTATPSTPGGTYSWSPGGATTQSITVSPGSTTIYTVTYSLSGCSNTGSGTVTVNAIPSVTVNSSAICAGQTATLTATPSTPGGTYLWSPGGATTQAITVSPGSTTIYTVTYSLSGCSNTGSGTVTVNTVPSVTVNSSAICAGQSATLTATPSTPGGTYSWSPGGATTQSITVSPGSTTIYTVTYSLSGCSNTGSGTVTVNAAPSITVNSSAICAGQNATLTATPSLPGGTYSWSPGGATTQTITVSPASTTTYTVTYSLSGCSNTGSGTVTVNAIPSVTVNSSAICAGQSAILTATPSTPGGTYSWSPGGATTQSITVSPASTTTYTVTYSLSGCSNTGSGTVTVNAIPSVTVNSSAICAGQSATLTATPSTPGGTYSWSPGGATTQTITVSPASTTTYTVTYSLSGCSNTGSGTVTVNAIPSVTVNSSAICAGQSATLTATPSTPGGTYSWSPGGATTQSITLSPGSTTIYTVTYSLSGCSNTGSGTVTVNAVPSVTVNSSAICAGQSATLTATPSTPGGTYSWSPGGATTQTITVSPASTTTYTVTYTLSGCSNIGSGTVTVISSIPSVSVISTSTSICSGGSVTFTATPTNGGSNPTYQWKINGVNVAGQTASTFTTSSLANGNTVTVVMTSNDPCASPLIATSNSISITTTSVTTSVSIATSTTSICSGSSVTFTATPINGGSNPTYQWMINGVNVTGQTASTFTTSTLANGNTVTVVMTSNDPCASPATATSNSISITTTSVTPSVSITASTTSICSGGSVTFTATPTNGGSSPTYQWKINGVNVTGQTASTFTTTSLANGNTVTVVMTSNDPCASPVTATGNSISISITSVTPSVSIAASTTSICTGGSVTFTATPTNGGSSPAYQWMINGVNVAGQTASTFTSSTLANGNIITVVMTSNDPCASPLIATSNSVGITTTSVIPSVSIAASTTSICTGGSVTFTATPTNGGSGPTYQWMINGVNVGGQTASTFTSSTLTNGNIITVVMTSNDPCASPLIATSNSIGITTATVIPSVSIAASTTSICTGGSVTFTATPTNGGSGPTYQWMINGVNVGGQTASTFTSSTLTNGNIITVVMTSNDPCASPATATSNSIGITTTTVAPSVSITSTITSICSGGSVTFTATPTNGGPGPTYQWMINGVNVVGQTASTFTTSSLSNGNAVSVMMTSNDPCANPVAPVQSQSITITSGAPALMITNPRTVCAPVSVDLTAALVTAGSQAGLVFSYWLDANATTPLTNPNAIINTGTYYIKAQDAGGCFITKPVNVSIEQKINGIRYPDIIATANSPLQLNARIPGTGYLYSWSPPTGLNLSNIKDPVFINNTGLEYLIRITSPAGCITVDTLLVKMTPVVQFQTPDVFVPKAWSPNGDGHNDLLFPFLVNISELKYFRIYDRWGQKVFETNINGKGWNGVYNGQQQVADVYTWVIEAVGVDGKTIRRSGNAVLLR